VCTSCDSHAIPGHKTTRQPKLQRPRRLRLRSYRLPFLMSAKRSDTSANRQPHDGVVSIYPTAVQKALTAAGDPHGVPRNPCGNTITASCVSLPFHPCGRPPKVASAIPDLRRIHLALQLVNGSPRFPPATERMYAGVAFPDGIICASSSTILCTAETISATHSHAFFIMSGGQYGGTFHRERSVEALAGEGTLNGTWFSTANTGFKNGKYGTIASLPNPRGASTLPSAFTPHSVSRAAAAQQLRPHHSAQQGSRPYHLAAYPITLGGSPPAWSGSRARSEMYYRPKLRLAVQSKPRSSSKAESFGHIHLFSDDWYSYLNFGPSNTTTFVGRSSALTWIIPRSFCQSSSSASPAKPIFGGSLSQSYKPSPASGSCPRRSLDPGSTTPVSSPSMASRAGMTAYTRRRSPGTPRTRTLPWNQNVGVHSAEMIGRFRTVLVLPHPTARRPSNPGSTR